MIDLLFFLNILDTFYEFLIIDSNVYANSCMTIYHSSLLVSLTPDYLTKNKRSAVLHSFKHCFKMICL